MSSSDPNMSQLTRNDSNSVISSLQMDYGDSDEEEVSSREASLNEPPSSDNAIPPHLQTDKNTENIDQTVEEPKTEGEPAVTETDNENIDMEDKNEDSSEGKKEIEVSPVDNISDDEDGEGHHHHHHHHHHHQTKLEEERKKALAEAISVDSPSSQGSRKAKRLVSYGPDDDQDEDESQSEEEPEAPESGGNSPDEESNDPAVLSRSVQNMASDDIKIPPEPPGKCAAQLQDNIISMYDRMTKEGLDLNKVIQNKKNFRNPSIYEKLIDFCRIDENGTNFPPEIYDPHLWGKESYYDELDKVQRKDMERREKEKKERTKIEFMTGTKKSSAPSDTSMGPDEKKRKTKWDAQPAGVSGPLLKAPGVQNPGVVNLTATATGTKATIISAVGSLSKKSSGK